MRIRLVRTINASPLTAIAAAEAWLREEATGESTQRSSEGNGRETVTLQQLNDGIAITTRFVASPSANGTTLEFHLRMQGTSRGSKVRNVGMLPMTGIVRREAERQLSALVDNIEGQ